MSYPSVSDPYFLIRRRFSLPLSESIYSILSCGYSGSRGTYAPPAFMIPTNASTNSLVLPHKIPATFSRPKPLFFSLSAIYSDTASSSAYVIVPFSSFTAVLSGYFDTASRNRSIKVFPIYCGVFTILSCSSNRRRISDGSFPSRKALVVISRFSIRYSAVSFSNKSLLYSSS